MYKLVNKSILAKVCSILLTRCPNSCATLIPKAPHNNPILITLPTMVAVDKEGACKEFKKIQSE